MVTKLPGIHAPDHAKYGNLTDGVGNEVTEVIYLGSGKQLTSEQAPDGSYYFCLTNAAGDIIPVTTDTQFLLLFNATDLLLLANGIDKLVLIGQGPQVPVVQGAFYFYLGF